MEPSDQRPIEARLADADPGVRRAAIRECRAHRGAGAEALAGAIVPLLGSGESAAREAAAQAQSFAENKEGYRKHFAPVP